ncbi:RNA-binding cell elongation regulator Jag/EloR [Anaerococcus sp. mt242]|uniref:RNA-binding cell elongation regulator Jag/EloR n=1 Tax=Anaerococcus sp. mt242 TaxID=2661917 RepID=UPI001EE3CF9D|nr:RNA-binding cell elongation regulator Jag/EloR [Anaerococcus sp. mt242]
MRKSIIKQAKTKDEAIRKGLLEIGKNRSDVDIEVIEEGSAGFLGLGAKDAVVRISFDEDINEAMIDLENEIRYDSLQSGEFDKEYNINDRSKYYADEARANYQSDNKDLLEDDSHELIEKEGRDFEESIHQITDDDENHGEYERLQKINSYEENSKGYKSENVDLTKELDERISQIDSTEHLETKVVDPWEESSTKENSNKNEEIPTKRFENVEFAKEESHEDNTEANDYKVISRSSKMTFESTPSENIENPTKDIENQDLIQGKEETNSVENFKVEAKANIAQEKQQTDIEKFYKAKEFLENILKEMHFENPSVYGNLEGSIIKLDAKVAEEDTGIAIGKGGATLDAIELLVRKSIDSRANNLRVNVDINNYKKRRDEKIVELAADTARKVQRSKKPWNLKYMNSYERRLAHEEISKYPNITSHSEGMEPKRYVVVSYVGDEEE